MTAAEALDHPVLVGARPKEPARGFFARRRQRRSEVFGTLPDAVYEQPIHKSWSPLGTFVLVSDPQGVKRVMIDNVANYPKTDMEQRAFTALFGHGLLGTDGEMWRLHRRIMAPAFQPSSVATYAPAMAGAAAAFTKRWDSLGAGATVDVGDEMSLLALQIISKTMFSTDSDDVIGHVSRAMKDGFGSVGFSILDILPIIGPSNMRKREQKMAEIFSPLDKTVYRLIDERVANHGEGPQDLLGRLVAATDEQTGAKMSVREVRDEVVTIFIAGHETTAVSMSWIWYLLAHYPQVLARLEDELERVLGGRTPGQDDLEKLVYTRQIVEETMRLYPPAPALSTRACLKDDEVAGVRIRAGQSIGVAPWVLHRHRALWENPEAFDPDRWAPGRASSRPRFGYLPFGAGPRVCIGQLMAMNEVILILATLAQRYRLQLAPDANVVARQQITLRPMGLRMILRPRAATAASAPAVLQAQAS